MLTKVTLRNGSTNLKFEQRRRNLSSDELTWIDENRNAVSDNQLVEELNKVFRTGDHVTIRSIQYEVTEFGECRSPT